MERLDKDERGNWFLSGDNPEWDNIPLPNNAEIVGEVKWPGKTYYEGKIISEAKKQVIRNLRQKIQVYK